MKLKVKGLVFVGFAAAVFAQSALAADGDNKVVTSKKYVDEKFQTLEKITTTSELTVAGNVTQEMVNAHWASNEEYPSMAVLKSVKDTVTGMSFSGDNKYIDVATDNGATSVTLDTNNLASDAAAITSTASGDSTTPAAQDKLVKVSAVNDYAEAKANKKTSIASTDVSTTDYPTTGAVVGYAQDKSKMLAYSTADTTETISSHSSSNDTYPTTQNVYQFVTGAISGASGNYQQHVSSATGYNSASLYVGHNGSWNALEAVDTTGTLSTNNYVIIKENSGVYNVDLRTEQIAATIASTGSAKLATEGAVYDYVSGGYQPKTTGTTVKVGYDGNWRELTVDSTYMSLDTTTGAAVTLTNLTSATTDVSSSAGTKLVTSGVLYDMLGGLSIPAPEGECANSALNSDSAGACALVMAWDGTANSNQGAVTLKWRKMAQ